MNARIFLFLFFSQACQFSDTNETSNTENINKDTSKADLSIEEGEKLFKDDCMACHSIHEEIIGPALKNIDSLDRQWLYLWIKDSQALIRSGDKRANEIFNYYSKAVQPGYNLSEVQIDNIVKYINSQKLLYNNPPIIIRN